MPELLQCSHSSDTFNILSHEMIISVILLVIVCFLSQLISTEAKSVNVKVWGKKYWVDVPFIKEKQVTLFEKDYCDLSDEEKLKYVNRVVGLPPSEGRKHVWEMSKKWIGRQLTETRKSVVEDANEIMDAKIPSDRAYAVVNFALNHKIITATGVAGMYYLSKTLLGPSPSERAMAKVKEYQDKLNRGKKL